MSLIRNNRHCSRFSIVTVDKLIEARNLFKHTNLFWHKLQSLINQYSDENVGELTPYGIEESKKLGLSFIENYSGFLNNFKESRIIKYCSNSKRSCDTLRNFLLAFPTNDKMNKIVESIVINDELSFLENANFPEYDKFENEFRLFFENKVVPLIGRNLKNNSSMKFKDLITLSEAIILDYVNNGSIVYKQIFNDEIKNEFETISNKY
ncbi:MAG: hypothetical protein MHPSP_000594, partial [Paramarteilia canceri]